MALWGGRFEAGVAEVTQEFGASLPVDKHLYKQDIAGSKAHAKCWRLRASSVPRTSRRLPRA